MSPNLSLKYHNWYLRTYSEYQRVLKYPKKSILFLLSLYLRFPDNTLTSQILLPVHRSSKDPWTSSEKEVIAWDWRSQNHLYKDNHKPVVFLSPFWSDSQKHFSCPEVDRADSTPRPCAVTRRVSETRKYTFDFGSFGSM